MELFKGQSLLEFTERFKTDLDYVKHFLYVLKWQLQLKGYQPHKLLVVMKLVVRLHIIYAQGSWSYEIQWIAQNEW